MILSIVMPAHNEEENIGDSIAKVESTVDIPHELIVVNDHSNDATAEIVKGMMKKYPSVRLINNAAAPGFVNALKAGFALAQTQLVVPVMGDLCDDLPTIKNMLKKIEEGYDVVCGSRYISGGKRNGGSKLKAFLSRAAGRSLYHILGIPTHDIANAFKMYKKEILDRITVEAKGFEISMELPLKAYYMGYKITEVPTVWKERTKGASSFKVFRLLPSYIKFYLWAVFNKFKAR
ncbi:MAG: glycosyltransferase [Candidatus Omnitrophica bacterium]|nr:glycosyltransferase [Candidatus Omnitrophota bacterium]